MVCNESYKLSGEKCGARLQRTDETMEFDWHGIDFPVSLKAVDKFEKQNEDIAIHVLRFDEFKKEIYPLRVPKHGTMRPKCIDLLLIADGQNQYYCIVKNSEK